jgi:hypothetical protein
MDIATVFEWFAQESKNIAEQATESAQREKFVKLASLWANAMAESISATWLPRPDSAEAVQRGNRSQQATRRATITPACAARRQRTHVAPVSESVGR